jgi:ABC-type branched-subunit amino acid transport system ATPase component/ABC-type branched-subunit amino acid transport system permease subunit
MAAPIFAGASVGSVVLVLISLLLILAGPLQLNNAFYMHILQQIAFYTIAAIGLNVLVGYQGQVSLGHGGLFAVGAYTSALLATHPQLKEWFGSNPPVWIDLIIASAVAGLVGALLALPTLRAKGPYLAMVTIAFSVVVFVVAQTWTELTKGPEGIKNIPRPEWFGGVRLSDIRTFQPIPGGPSFTGDVAYFWVVAVAALVVQLLANNLLTGRWGRTINAVRQSEIASETVGVSVYRWKVAAFAFSAVLAGLAGAFFAHQSAYIVSDTFTFNLSVQLLVYVILGGARTLFGPLVGATVLVILPEALKTLSAYNILPAAAQPLVEHYLLLYGILLIVFLVSMPQGMVGALRNIPGLAGLLPAQPVPVKSAEASFGQAAGRTPHVAHAERPTLAAENVKMYFGGLRAVDDVSLHIRPGQIHGLIGPNGSGKSTIVNVFTGVYRPTDGRVVLGEHVLNALPPHSIAALGVTRTFQNIQLFKDLSVLDNVMMGFHLRLKSGFFDQLLSTKRYLREEQEYRQRAMDLLAFLQIDHLAGAEAQSLPYGLQRLVEIARALASGPTVLILDEPAAGINASEIGQVSAVIRRVRDTGVTILVIEHHMDLVMGVSDHVAALDYGKLIAEGTPAEIQANQKVIEAYLGDQEMFAVPQTGVLTPAPPAPSGSSSG